MAHDSGKCCHLRCCWWWLREFALELLELVSHGLAEVALFLEPLLELSDLRATSLDLGVEFLLSGLELRVRAREDIEDLDELLVAGHELLVHCEELALC